LAAVGNYLPTLLVLALLGGIGWWGAAHDWKLGGIQEDKEKQESSAKPEAGDDDPNKPLRPVELASAEAVARAGIVVEKAQQRSLGDEIIATGEVDYDQSHIAHLGSRVNGTVWSVEKHTGDPLVKGSVLALISSAEVGKAKAEFLYSLVEYQLKSKVLERLQAAATSIPEKQIREGEAQMREARIRLFGAQQTLLNLGLEIRLDDVLKMTDEQVVGRLRTLGLPYEVLQGVDTATLTNNLVPITSPFEGIVIKRDLVVGEQVNTMAVHFIVADLRRVSILLNVRLEDVSKLALRQEVRFQVEGFKDEVPSGTLSWISAEVDDKTHTLAVRADVPNPDGRLRPHSFGTGRILAGQRYAVTVPKEAVQWDADSKDGDSSVVFVRVSETAFQPRRVKVGMQLEKLAEIVSGLKAGEEVATAGSHRLKSEMHKDLISGED
jgi:cobalt-zinc-cadmium efflux system membrane fusion protein